MFDAFLFRDTTSRFKPRVSWYLQLALRGNMLWQDA